MKLRSLSLVALTFVCFACTAQEDDASSSAEDLTLRPTDTDPLTQATLTVTLPDGLSPSIDKRALRVSGPSFAYPASPITYGVPITGRAGAWRVCFTQTITDECYALTTTPGQSITVQLGAVLVDVKGPPLAPNPPAPDFGPSPDAPRYKLWFFKLNADNTSFVYTNTPAGAVFFPGQIHVTASTASDFDKVVDVKPGNVTVVTGTDEVYKAPPTPFDLHVTFEAAELPTVGSPNGSTFTLSGAVSNDRSADWTYPPYGSVPLSQWVAIFRAATIQRTTSAADVKLTGLACPGCTASLTNAAGVKIAVPMTGPQTIALKRLDVDGVDVTPSDPPHVPYRVQGTWTVTDAKGTRLGPFPTGYGLDLPPGPYSVVIAYSTKEKPAQTQTFAVDLE